MKNLRIRQAGPSDLATVARIEAACFRAADRSEPRAMRRSLNSGFQSVWLASIGRDPVACLFLFHYPRTLRIYSIAVLPEFQGRGIGRRLVAYTLQLAEKSGHRAVSLEADAANHLLIRWYRQLGFTPRETLPGYYTPTRPALRLCRDL